MGYFLVYLFKSAFCLVLFYLFYKLLLSKETFHRFNRVFLLALWGISALLPMVEYRLEHPTEWQQTFLSLEQWLVLEEEAIQSQPALAAQSEDAYGVGGLLVIYVLGVLFFGGRNLFSLGRLARLLRRCRRVSIEAYLPLPAEKSVLLVHPYEVAPFSWMHYVVVSQKDLQENAREILTHELAHIRLRHSWDLLWVDICILLQWFNPAAWLLKRELQAIHEYEADEAVLRAGINAKQYQLLIIKKAVGARLYSMANSLNHSSLKKRITMMMKEKSNPWARLKYLCVLPVAAIAVTAFARPEVSSVANEISSAKVNDFVSMVKAKLPANQDTVKYVSPSTKKELKGKLVMAEKMPRFSQGGMPGLKKYIDEHLKYPQAAKQAGKQGRVVLQFVVEADGSLSNIHVLRSLDPEMDAAAIRVFQDMPKWEPGMQDGKAVAVKYTMPVQFKLPADSGNPASSTKKEGLEEVIIKVDGKEISKEELEKIDPATIQSMTVIKDSLAIKSVGGKAKNGIICIVLKKDGTDAASSEVSAMSVKGVVVDEAGDPVIGACVLIAGTKHGTITDSQGTFTLQAPKDAVLQISYIGVGTETVKAQPAVKVVLKSKK